MIIEVATSSDRTTVAVAADPQSRRRRRRRRCTPIYQNDFKSVWRLLSLPYTIYCARVGSAAIHEWVGHSALIGCRLSVVACFLRARCDDRAAAGQDDFFICRTFPVSEYWARDVWFEDVPGAIRCLPVRHVYHAFRRTLAVFFGRTVETEIGMRLRRTTIDVVCSFTFIIINLSPDPREVQILSFVFFRF